MIFNATETNFIKWVLLRKEYFKIISLWISENLGGKKSLQLLHDSIFINSIDKTIFFRIPCTNLNSFKALTKERRLFSQCSWNYVPVNKYVPFFIHNQSLTKGLICNKSILKENWIKN